MTKRRVVCSLLLFEGFTYNATNKLYRGLLRLLIVREGKVDLYPYASKLIFRV